MMEGSISDGLRKESPLMANMHPLEVLIAIKRTSKEHDKKIREEFSRTDIYALGMAAGETKPDGSGTEGDLLHFAIDDEESGQEKIMFPVFTRPDAIREAITRNPDWLQLSVLQVKGDDLLEHLEHDVTIVINPWTDIEYQFPVVETAATNPDAS